MQPSQMHDCIFFCTVNIHRQNHSITYKKHRLAQTRHRLAQYYINPPKSVKIRGKTNPQRDLKGRMPERSEWLLAEGVAKRNPRYRNAHYYASERRENRLPWQLLSRLSDAFLCGCRFPGGCAIA